MKSGQKQTGFTIVELLIVIVVIGILAAITVVAYSGIQNRANDTTVKADLSNAAKKLEVAKVELGRYPASVTEMPDGFSLSKSSYDISANNVYYCNDEVNHTYALGIRSKSMKGYIQTSSGLQEGVTVHGAATCDAIGKDWVNDDTTAVIQGWNVNTGTGVWHAGWSWVK